MAVDFVRVEETVTTVRYESVNRRPEDRPVDATTDVHLLLRYARMELNKHRDPEDPRDDRQPGYGELWIEPAGDISDGDKRIAVCFRRTERVRSDNGSG